jgi:hypothetical protein
MEHKAKAQCAQLATDLRQLLRNGSLEQANPMLAQLEANAAAARLEANYADVTLLGEALLYRFFDRDARRAQLVSKALSDASRALTTDRKLARAAMRIEDDPLGLLPELRELMETAKDDVHAAELTGMAASRANKAALAEKAFARAELLEPPHLPYLYQQLEHWKKTGKSVEAKNLVSRMTDVSPNSPWTKLALALVGESSREEIAALAKAGDAAPVVQQLAQHLLEAHAVK